MSDAPKIRNKARGAGRGWQAIYIILAATTFGVWKQDLYAGLFVLTICAFVVECFEVPANAD